MSLAVTGIVDVAVTGSVDVAVTGMSLAVTGSVDVAITGSVGVTCSMCRKLNSWIERRGKNLQPELQRKV